MEWKVLGNLGEDAAKNYLLKQSFEIIALKYAKKWGEIDLITRKSGVFHFVEVKTSLFRPESSFLPEIRVNRKKAYKLRRTCEIYLSEIKASPDQNWQIDVISVILNADGSLNSLNHFENAVFGEKY